MPFHLRRDVAFDAVRVAGDGEELLAGPRAPERRLGRQGAQRYQLGGPGRVGNQQECNQESHGFASTMVGNVLVERVSPGLPSTSGRTTSLISCGTVEIKLVERPLV